MVLNGTTSQNTLGTTNRLTLLGGVLRGNTTQIGFTSAGAGFLNFRGGVLEITNGANGTGTSADYHPPAGQYGNGGRHQLDDQRDRRGKRRLFGLRGGGER